MMKLNSRWLVLLIPVITGLFCATWVGIASWQKKHFACDAQLTIVEQTGYNDVILHFRFAGQTGHLETKGKYVQKTGEIIQTSNKVDFTFWRDGSSLVLIANETNKIPKVPVPVLENMPDFFTARERGIRLQIIRKNASAYVFLYEGTPALYCSISQ